MESNGEGMLTAIQPIPYLINFNNFLHVCDCKCNWLLFLYTAMKIHMSSATYTELLKHIGYKIEHRGEIPIKGKGVMDTYWLVSKIR